MQPRPKATIRRLSQCVPKVTVLRSLKRRPLSPRTRGPWGEDMRRLIVAASVLLLEYSLAQADPPQTRQARVNGVNLTYQEQGEGKPVVFVPGAGANYRVWDGEREAVAPHHRFVALTQRYFGTEPCSDDGSHFSMTTQAYDRAGFIRELNA